MILEIDAVPVPKGRPCFTRAGHVYTPKRTRDYEKLIGLSYRANGGKRHVGPVNVELRFYYRYGADLDNFVKAALDGLNGVAWLDDRQVVFITASKVKDTKNPRLTIAIEPLTVPDGTKGEA